MASKHWLLPALATGFLLSGVAFGDELAVPAGAPAPTSNASGESPDRPARGMSMEKVEAKFGAPAKRVPAVGEPPISRWEYPGFVVYFENNLVIHAVATG
jgi:hypothetical protein